MNETDPRFPSGPWVGFFVQGYGMVGKHWMELSLNFISGVLNGEGRDRVGRFVIKGSYDTTDGKCQWQKSYVGEHCVYYSGFNEGKGIWGAWEIPAGPDSQIRLHGGFHIWPKGMGAADGSALEESADLPIDGDVESTPILQPAGPAPARIGRARDAL
jgi:hypothetical protein